MLLQKKQSSPRKRPSSSTIFLVLMTVVFVVAQLIILASVHTHCDSSSRLESQQEAAIPSISTFKTKGQIKKKQIQKQKVQSPQYNFDTIPSRKWEIYPHPFPCYPPPGLQPNKLMLRTPTDEGILFQRPTKVGSTTMTNIVLRLAHNRGAAEKKKSANATDASYKAWEKAKFCNLRTMHEASIDLHYGHRNREKSFLFSLVRDPTKRAISEYFHFRVSMIPQDPTDVNMLKYVMRPRNSNFHLRLLTFDRTLPLKMSAEYEHFLQAHHNQQQSRKNITRKIKIRGPISDLVKNDNVSESLNYTKIVQGILDAYDFIAVTERMDESLVAMKLLLGLSVEEIVYAKISRAAGSFSNGDPKTRICIYLVPSFLTPTMNDFFYTPQQNEPWIAYTKGDALMHQAASLSLDRTIDEVFGRETFDREMAEFKNALEYTQAICASEPDLVLSSCDDGGNSVLRDPNRNTTCYIWDEGCDHKCINEKVPSPIPKRVLEGTQKFEK